MAFTEPLYHKELNPTELSDVCRFLKANNLSIITIKEKNRRTDDRYRLHNLSSVVASTLAKQQFDFFAERGQYQVLRNYDRKMVSHKSKNFH
jgi:prophage antirepressor-like protein